MRFGLRAFSLLCALWRFALQFAWASPLDQFDPNDPSASGYRKVFEDDFIDNAGIDLNRTGKPGYRWYLTKFIKGHVPTPPESLVVKDGVLTLTPTDSTNWSLASAGPSQNGTGYVGQAFGGGFFVEARISFSPNLSNAERGWPAFWSIAIEKLTLNGADHWEDQEPEFEHFAEDDLFEYNISAWAGPNSFTSTMLDWYGKWRKTCSEGFCRIGNFGKPSRFDNHVVHIREVVNWREFHRIAQLWIPATSEPNSKGYIQNYFDGLPTRSRVSWSKYQEGTPPPPTGDAIFSIIDRQHLVIIIGSGMDQPLRVDWVRVWQLQK
ncbi:hypothetical protein [Methylocystis echinoides]|uniref:hypothetical protein n=1 Tax=Methylocystis echinoides TaxID=29468 RepID=UPI00341EF069